jgi:hypothetical protein
MLDFFLYFYKGTMLYRIEPTWWERKKENKFESKQTSFGPVL